MIKSTKQPVDQVVDLVHVRLLGPRLLLHLPQLRFDHSHFLLHGDRVAILFELGVELLHHGGHLRQWCLWLWVLEMRRRWTLILSPLKADDGYVSKAKEDHGHLVSHLLQHLRLPCQHSLQLCDPRHMVARAHLLSWFHLERGFGQRNFNLGELTFDVHSVFHLVKESTWQTRRWGRRQSLWIQSEN